MTRDLLGLGLYLHKLFLRAGVSTAACTVV